MSAWLISRKTTLCSASAARVTEYSPSQSSPLGSNAQKKIFARVGHLRSALRRHRHGETAPRPHHREWAGSRADRRGKTATRAQTQFLRAERPPLARAIAPPHPQSSSRPLPQLSDLPLSRCEHERVHRPVGGALGWEEAAAEMPSCPKEEDSRAQATCASPPHRRLPVSSSPATRRGA